MKQYTAHNKLAESQLLIMKSAILYPYGPLRGTGCCRMLHAKHLALTSAVYTLVSSTIHEIFNV